MDVTFKVILRPTGWSSIFRSVMLLAISVASLSLASGSTVTVTGTNGSAGTAGGSASATAAVGTDAANTATATGGNGGAGGYAKSFFSAASIGSSQAITVGAGGDGVDEPRCGLRRHLLDDFQGYHFAGNFREALDPPTNMHEVILVDEHDVARLDLRVQIHLRQFRAAPCDLDAAFSTQRGDAAAARDRHADRHVGH